MPSPITTSASLKSRVIPKRLGVTDHKSSAASVHPFGRSDTSRIEGAVMQHGETRCHHQCVRSHLTGKQRRSGLIVRVSDPVCYKRKADPCPALPSPAPFDSNRIRPPECEDHAPIHLQKNFWFILQIRVHYPDALSRCEGQTGRDRTLMAEVANQNNELYRWVDAGPLFDKVRASIGRSVAHKEQFPCDWPILNFF
jgi:hypothetical protein